MWSLMAPGWQHSENSKVPKLGRASTKAVSHIHPGNSSSIVVQSTNILFQISLYQKCFSSTKSPPFPLRGLCFLKKDSKFQPLAWWTICRTIRTWVPSCRSVSYMLLAEGHMETGFMSLQSSVEYPAYASEDQTRRPFRFKEGTSCLRPIWTEMQNTCSSSMTICYSTTLLFRALR